MLCRWHLGEPHSSIPPISFISQLSVVGAVGMLTAITALITVSSEMLTDSIKDVSVNSGLNLHFIGVVLLPVIGNACEHLTAVLVAMKNKMDLSMSGASRHSR